MNTRTSPTTWTKRSLSVQIQNAKSQSTMVAYKCHGRRQVLVFLFLLTRVSHGLSPPSSRLFIGDYTSLGSVVVRVQSTNVALSARSKEGDDELPFPLDLDADTPIIIRGSDNDDIDGSIWEDAETGQPPEWLVMKEV